MRDLFGFETDGDNIMGRVCEACSRDETQVEFDPITGEYLAIIFPAKDWRGWVRCSECGAVSDKHGNYDRSRTLAVEEAFAYQKDHPSGPRLNITMPAVETD